MENEDETDSNELMERESTDIEESEKIRTCSEHEIPYRGAASRYLRFIAYVMLSTISLLFSMHYSSSSLFLLLFLSFASASNFYKNFNDFGFAVSSNFQRQPKLTCTALVLPCCPFLQHNPLDNVLPSRSFEEPATSV